MADQASEASYVISRSRGCSRDLADSLDEVQPLGDLRTSSIGDRMVRATTTEAAMQETRGRGKTMMNCKTISHVMFCGPNDDKNRNGGKATPQGAKSYDKTVAAATGGGADDGGGVELVPRTGDAAAMVETVSPDDIARLLAREDIEWAPQVYTMKKYEKVEGFLEGNGPEAEITSVDRATKEVKTSIVKTWIVRSPDGSKRISILSTAQLDRKLPPFINDPGGVIIVRGEETDTRNGYRVTDYLVGGAKLKGGALRSFAFAVPAQAALPAAGESSAHVHTNSEHA